MRFGITDRSSGVFDRFSFLYFDGCSFRHFAYTPERVYPAHASSHLRRNTGAVVWNLFCCPTAFPFISSLIRPRFREWASTTPAPHTSLPQLHAPTQPALSVPAPLICASMLEHRTWCGGVAALPLIHFRVQLLVAMPLAWPCELSATSSGFLSRLPMSAYIHDVPPLTLDALPEMGTSVVACLSQSCLMCRAVVELPAAPCFQSLCSRAVYKPYLGAAAPVAVQRCGPASCTLFTTMPWPGSIVRLRPPSTGALAIAFLRPALAIQFTCQVRRYVCRRPRLPRVAQTVRFATAFQACPAGVAVFHDKLKSFRFGEASHPGPTGDAPQVARVAVVNPTAIFRKEPEFLELDADLIGISETSAVAKVQRSFSAGMRPHRYQVFYSSPVPPHGQDADPRSAVRGLAGGTALATRLPARASPSPFEPPVAQTTRVVEAFVRFGCLEVRCLSVYGVPSSHRDAAELNTLLLETVLRRASQNKIPTLVLGDMNVDVTSLPVWHRFVQLGFSEAFQVATARFGVELPPTCKNATRYDTALMQPPLVDMLVQAQVLTASHIFDSHAPLLLDFKVPAKMPVLHRWALPRPWTDFAFSRQTFAEAYQAREQEVVDAISSVQGGADPSGAFRTWAAALEASVDVAIQVAGVSTPAGPVRQGLPRSHRGRCRSVKRVPRDVTQAARPARHGDFLPQHEVTSRLCKQRLRQCRRARTLQQGLTKFLAHPMPPDSQFQQLLNEWHAIHRAAGYPGGFRHWVLSWQCVTWYPLDFPSLPWLSDLVQLLQFDCQALAAAEAAQRRRSFRVAVEQDEQVGFSRQGYRSIRPASKPPFTAVSTEIEQPLQRLAPATLGEWECTVPKPSLFRPGMPATVGGVEGLVVEVSATSVRVAFGDQFPPREGNLCQLHNDCTPAELHEGFRRYWSTYWQRDTPQEVDDLNLWPDFQALLARFPAPWGQLDVDMLNVDIWHRVRQQMRTGSATGACGFSVAELKSIPMTALGHLARLFHASTAAGLPPFLLLGRVNVLAKVMDPKGHHEGRPICVLPVLYRLCGVPFCASNSFPCGAAGSHVASMGGCQVVPPGT